MIDIGQIENLEVTPDNSEYPYSPWVKDSTQGERYNGAFDVTTQEDADIHLLMCIGWALRYKDLPIKRPNGNITGWRKLTWKEAVADQRESIAWMAFAKDVVILYREDRGVKIENTHNRDFVKQWYKAELPERVAGNRSKSDILEDVHRKREKAAKAKGETYWRKVQDLPAQVQDGLFDFDKVA